MELKIITSPVGITAEYEKGAEFKAGIGKHGIFEQSKRNERFFIGDQWYGCKAGNDRPLIRENIIKRIGDYKLATISAPPIAVNYSAEGVPSTADIQKQSLEMRNELIAGNVPQNAADDIEVSAVTSAMSDYFRTTAERLKFDNKKEQLLRNAYISGTGVLFTYWEDRIETGLYADAGKQQPIKGDIVCEVLNIENVNFGDPNNDDVQSQPYIIISQRRNVEEVKREAHRNRQPTDDIKADYENTQYVNAGDRGEDELPDSGRVTVYTKLYKEWDKDAETYKVMAVRVTENAIIRKPWCLNLKNYPIAKFSWERRNSSAYGESEITYLIPNQIAINRMRTAIAWGIITSGMPIMVVNGDTISDPVTNDPGQIIKVYGTNEDVAGAIRYVQPPNFTTQIQDVTKDLCSSTLSSSGANDAALGNLKPDNATAIIQMRKAALQPMQIQMNRFYDFIEDVARIWADFWMHYYGTRKLKVTSNGETQYLTFNAERYKNLLITARIDVGSTTMYDEPVIVSTLDALLSAQIINPLQYLERMPKGMIPDVSGLIDDLKEQMAPQVPSDELTEEELLQRLQEINPEAYQKLINLPPEVRSQLLNKLTGNMSVPTTGTPTGAPQTEEIGDL